MKFRTICCGFIAATALAVPAAADPYQPKPMLPGDEAAMIRRNQSARERLAAIKVWTFAVAVNSAIAEQARYDEMQRARVAAAVEHFTEEPEPSTVTLEGDGNCGGDLPDCSIMECESGGSLTAENPSSSASGKWQILDGSWNGYGGYSHAADAPEEVQDGRARELWADSHGHWEQCGG